MSELGNIYLSYGTQFNVSIANTYSYNVLSGSNLPVNSLIISSPVNEINNDIGTYSLLVTDIEGNPVRLTYTIKEGNGLGSDEKNKDIIYLKIDDDTIKDTNNGIAVDLSSFDNNIIYIKDNKFLVDTSKINNIASDSRGIAKPDNKTIKNDNTKIFVNTEKLTYSNNATNQYGILSNSDGIISINNGVISLNENNIPKAKTGVYGTIKADEYTITIQNAEPIVKTENLNYCNQNSFGIVSVDEDKILANSGELSVNTQSLNKANVDTLGILNIDNNTISINENDSITIPEYNILFDEIYSIEEEMNNNINSLENIKNDILIQVK